MYDLTKADEFYEELKIADPEFDHKMMKCFRKRMPHQFAKLMYEKKHGHHLVTKEQYDEAASLLKWIEDKGSGPKWKVEEIVKLSNIDFDNKKYHPHDFAYAVNMLYAENCNTLTEPSYYLKMAKNFLENPNYPGDPSERAYHCAMKRIESYEEEAAV